MTDKPEGLKFPNLGSTVLGRWAPLYLYPILGSAERFIIAVAVVGEDDFHIEPANKLARLECLYGRSAETAIFATEVAIEELQSRLGENGEKALEEGVAILSGVIVGPVAVGEARDLQQIGRMWMSALSSLYADNVFSKADVLYSVGGPGASDRLPALVLQHVAQVDPKLIQYFSDEIRHNRTRRASSSVANISIDYDGSLLVANLATLQVSSTALAVDRIKRKMFDLKVRRDNEKGLFNERHHEMIVYASSKNDPQVTLRQWDRIGEALERLKEQSLNEELGFSALNAVPEIGERIIQSEKQHLNS